MSYGDKYHSTFVPDPSLVQYVKGKAKEIGGKKVVDIPRVVATEESLEGYGELIGSKDFDNTHVRILQWPAPGKRAVRGGVGGGVVEGSFTAEWDKEGKCRVRNEGVKGEYMIGWKEGSDIILQDANYHPDSSQVFAPEGENGPEPYILVLSKHHTEENVLPSDFVAFYFFGNTGVRIHPFTWHMAIFPTGAKAHLKTKQGKAHASVDADFVREFGVHLRIPDAFAPKTPDDLPKTVPDLISPDDPRPEDKDLDFTGFDPTRFRRGSIIVSDVAVAKQKLSMQSPTEQNFSPYGVIVDRSRPPKEETIEVKKWPQRGAREVYLGDEAGITTKNFAIDWDDRHLDNQDMLTIYEGKWRPSGVTHCNKSETFLIDTLFTRIDGGHLICGREEASFGLLVGHSDKEGEVEGRKVEVFLIPPDKGVLLKPGIWRSAPFISAKEPSQLLFQEKYSAVNAHMEFRLLEEGLKTPFKVDGTNFN